MSRTRTADPLPLGLALLALGAGAAFVTLRSLAEADVSYTRSQWTALLALMLASPAIILYALSAEPPGRWWRAFWTAGAIAYGMHFWWAVFRTYDGDFAAIVARQGWVGYTNFAVTALWALDVAAAWLWRPGDGAARIVLRFVAWAGVTASFLAASAVFRSGTIALIGYALAGAIVIAVLVRLFGFAGTSDARAA
jgi:hypothetical protein